MKEMENMFSLPNIKKVQVHNRKERAPQLDEYVHNFYDLFL